MVGPPLICKLYMTLLKQILSNEVQPVLGCTEPIAVALACSYAKNAAKGEIIKNIKVKIDQGILKNGMGVIIPNTNGEAGIEIAACLGTLTKNPSLGMEILKNIKKDDLKKAHQLIKHQKIKVKCIPNKELYIEAFIETEKGKGHAVIRDKHTNLVLLEKNGKKIKISSKKEKPNSKNSYQAKLSKMKIKDFIKEIIKMDQEDFKYIKKGIKMNLKMAKEGFKVKKVGYHISSLREKNFSQNHFLPTWKF